MNDARNASALDFAHDPPAADQAGLARRRQPEPAAGYVDPDCDAPLDEILDGIGDSNTGRRACRDTAAGHAGWECGLRLARRRARLFVADLLEAHGDHCTTAAGRADVRALARALLPPLAHECVTREWRTAAGGSGGVMAERPPEAADTPSIDDEPRRRAFKRGIFAGFLYGMADAVSRGVDGMALIEA